MLPEIDISSLSSEQLESLQTEIWELDTAVGDALFEMDGFVDAAPEFYPSSAVSEFGQVLPVFLGVAFLLWLFWSFVQYRVAKKAGHHKAWWAFVPVLGSLLRHDLAFGSHRAPWFLVYLTVTTSVMSLAFFSGFSEAVSTIGMVSTGGLYQTYPMPGVSTGLMSGSVITVALLVGWYEYYTRYKLYRAFGRTQWWYFLYIICPVVLVIQELILAFGKKISYVGFQSHELDGLFVNRSAD